MSTNKIDVLAVMDWAAREATPLAFALEIDNAAEAVAELIEAAKGFLAAGDNAVIPDGDDVAKMLDFADSEDRLRAALAKVTP